MLNFNYRLYLNVSCFTFVYLQYTKIAKSMMRSRFSPFSIAQKCSKVKKMSNAILALFGHNMMSSMYPELE